MKRFALLALVLGIFAAGCDKKSESPVAPQVLPSVYTYNSVGLPSNEIPAIVAPDPEAAGRAAAGLILTVTRDAAGVITGAKLDFNVSVNSFPATTNFTNFHIHQGNSTVANGSIVIASGLSNGELQLSNGAGQITKTNTSVAASLASSIIADPAGFYFNIHSTAHAPGVARGQLVLIEAH